MVARSVSAEHAAGSMRVPFAASSVAAARRELKVWMTSLGASPSQVEDARVVISELVGNAVRHAQPLPDGTVQVTWSVVPRGVQISVTDGGSGTRPRKLNAPSSATAGRGMAIVDSLSLSWWVKGGRTRSTVFAVLPLG